MRIAAPVTAADETFWIWQAVAHGAREFAVYAWYPMSSGFESNGYGLINLDGTLTNRARAAGKAAAIIGRHASHLLNATPEPARIAILYNRLSYMVGGSQSSLSKLGRAPIDSAMGLHQAFAQEQIPVDFVSTQELAANKLGQYKILFVPFPVMLSANVAEGIRQYVQNGGTMVAEARLAWNDERGFASPIIPGMGLDKVFGAREKLIAPSDKPEISVEKSTELPGWTGSSKISGAAYEEHLEPYAGARVLGRYADGDAAVVENSFGKGRTILVGTFLALGYEQHPEPATRQFLISLAASAGVSPEVEVSGTGAGKIEVRRLVSGSEQIVFAFNESNDSTDAALSLEFPWRPARAVDWMDGHDVQFATQQKKVLLKKTFTPHEVWVVSLEAHQ
jgi:beta-galactosidase